ncbi:probable tRNA (uracil-O(2)-)-methyltransferase isoform X3 [Nycticebus coucang]|uniref:probable tRNA (uracil-O(2)-)-methyltransferase isoform X3 n=1 Tax=Nycticebus coucang TaxID=9470 RepID=UPI00234C2676|nr:probable tRNA (uracil-O(2)-)-methyltransferase isoform X3 [Nycticebus coucang]
MAEVGRAAVRDSGGLLPGGFWGAVAVWLERPQVVNKRLCGARLEARRNVVLPRAEGPSADPEQEELGPSVRRMEEGLGPGSSSPGGLQEGTPCRGRGEARDQLQQTQKEATLPPLVAGDAGQPGKTGGREGDFPTADLDSLWDDFSTSLEGSNPEMLAFLTRPGAQREFEVILRTVIPKMSPHSRLVAPRREIVVQDIFNGAVTFLPLEEDDEGNLKVKMNNVYQIQLSHCKEEWFMSVLIFCPEGWHSDGILYPKPPWLGEELLAKLAKWSVENKRSEFKSTLSLISIMKYSKAYQELKEKYKEMVKVWPEVTDPEKFVYEDVAIATYLLILWEEERTKRGVTAKQSFVDLGCGNGLLVHILSSEGHPGRGIDVRRRKIWDTYGPQTQLEEAAITPNDKTLFPDVDWLIGNHSDELTPWIPVIASRSSYSCRFFVLPCCFFDFAGKYHRRQSKKTQYREYLDFIKEVGFACGFHVEEDCLRIPSTKRVCLIGKSRTYPPTAEPLVDEQRTQYITSRRGCPVRLPRGKPSSSSPRVAAGCPHDGHRALDVRVECAPEAKATTEHGAEVQVEGPWLPGFHPRDKAERVRNCATLPRDFIDQVVLQVANLLLGAKELNPRSSQNGSLKTWNGGVLNGRVHIRDWREEKLQKKKQPEAKRRLFSESFKTRVCWFFTHHPDGCVLPSDCCPFAHGPGELRPSQAAKRKRPIP